MVKWLLIIEGLDLLPNVFGQDPGKLFLQKFDGNVTIVPRPLLR